MQKTGEYIPVNKLKKKEMKEVPKVSMGIRLKDGSSLEGITPRAIKQYDSERPLKKRLMLSYLDQAGQPKRIDLEKLKGIEVVKGKGKYSGKLLIQFKYYKPPANVDEVDKLESNARIVFATGVSFGVHDTHIKHGEKKDFYLVAIDINKITNTDTGERNFPFWRILEMYGVPSEIAGKFKEPVKS